MNEPSTPAPAGEPGSTEPAVGKTKILGLDYKVAGLLAYLPICAINLISSVVWLMTEPPENRFLRFHALQSLVLCGAFIAVGILYWVVSLFLHLVPFLGFLSGLLSIVWLVVTVIFIWKCIVGMIAAYKGEMKKIEYVGDIAEKSL